MIKFGPAGNSESFYLEGHKETLEAPKWLKEKGLDAFEYSFGKGFILSSEKAIQIGKAFKDEGIALSLQAPYFINFSNPSEEMFEKTKGYIRTGIKFMRLMGADRMVFHPASCGKQTRDDALNLLKTRLTNFIKELEEEGSLEGIYLCPETMGKTMQIGTYREIIDLCKINEHLIPTFDFGHINALTQGSLKSPEDYLEIIKYCKENLGEFRTKNCHVHFSKIEYGAKGEIRHLTFEDNVYGPEFKDFLEIIKSEKLEPRIICESNGTMAEDAITMKNMYLGKKN